MPRTLDVRNYLDPLYTYVHQYTQLKKEELMQLLPFLEIRHFEKKELILHAGEIDNYFNIVMKGMVRKYISLGGSREVTLQLATEGHFIHSEMSFNTRTPSELCLQAVEQSILVRVEHARLEEIMHTFNWGEAKGRMLVVRMTACKEQRMYNMRMKSAKQRFLEYVEKHPQMMRRVPQHILASYLNINPQTFSRLKRLLRDKFD
jgi:CRP-like cAMP-binding protein